MPPTSKRNPEGDPRRALPPVDTLIRELLADAPDLPRWAAAAGARGALDRERERLRAGGATAAEGALRAAAAGAARALLGPRPRPVVNATGVVLHTNLGRAPLAPGAAAAAAAAAGYADLEIDLADGGRGRRLAGVVEKLRLLSGAAGAHVVNNNAAAVLLALDQLARGREVVVSRGELVEIGGSFRVPDIMERAGVRLVEVGTTNRTRIEDYERAIGPETALLLKVHRSNFELRGFVAEVALAELAALGRRRGLPVIEDLGSGTFLDLAEHGLPAEIHVPSRLRAGADLVCFSADKLLGGPQAGILVGDPELVEALCQSPLARALRIDKLDLAALDWTLEAHLDGRAPREVPVLRQLLAPAAQLEARARQLAERLRKLARGRLEVAVRPDRAAVGGGSLPGFELDTWVVSLRAACGAGEAAAQLRRAAHPVVARVREDRVLLDVRSLLPGDDPLVEAALAELLARVEPLGGFS